MDTTISASINGRMSWFFSQASLLWIYAAQIIYYIICNYINKFRATVLLLASWCQSDWPQPLSKSNKERYISWDKSKHRRSSFCSSIRTHKETLKSSDLPWWNINSLLVRAHLDSKHLAENVAFIHFPPLLHNQHVLIFLQMVFQIS